MSFGSEGEPQAVAKARGFSICELAQPVADITELFA
jgi:hypothetical protein